jgi:hypothetical protein
MWTLSRQKQHLLLDHHTNKRTAADQQALKREMNKQEPELEEEQNEQLH